MDYPLAVASSIKGRGRPFPVHKTAPFFVRGHHYHATSGVSLILKGCFCSQFFVVSLTYPPTLNPGATMRLGLGLVFDGVSRGGPPLSSLGRS